MENEASREKPEQPIPGISADFLTGNTETGLDRIRTRLLDLTNRNKLLNFRHSNVSSLRVVEASIDGVFRRLLDNEKLGFVPVPEPELDEEAKAGGRPTAKAYAEDLGWNTSFDLDPSAGEDDALRVLLYQDQLDTVGRKIATAANTAIEESGTNMLYLVFGFLEWYESDDSQQPRLAPLVTLPVTIERAGGKGKAVEAVIEYSGEDVETNLSLVEKIRRDFGLEIPPLEDEDTPESYFKKFDDILKLKKRWSIHPQISLALLSFGKLLMYRDLDPKTWPAGDSIAKHPLVRELFEGQKNPPNSERAEEYPIDAPELKQIVPHLIRDADSSQHSALIHALRGENLVIEGPPGTGKSQTITNLIAAALARGKTVLFVSEKLAALEVVRRRLDDAGLGVFCLEVHSHKTKKGALLNDLAQRCRMKGGFSDPRDLDRHLAVVEEKKRLLSQYASLINKPVEPFKATVFEILWARDRYGQEIEVHREKLGQVILPVVVRYSQIEYTQTEQFLSVYAQHLAEILALGKSVGGHPWAWIEKPLVFEEEEHVLELLDQFLSTIRQTEELCTKMEESAGIALSRSVGGIDHAGTTLAALPATGMVLVEELLIPCRSSATRQKIGRFIAHVKTFQRGLETLSVSFDETSSLLDAHTNGKLAGVLEHLRPWGLEGSTVAELRDLEAASSDTLKCVSEAEASYRVLLNVIGCEAAASLPAATFLLETIRIVEGAPFERLHLRHAAFESDAAKTTLEAARREAAAIKEVEAELGNEFDLSLGAGAHTPRDLVEYATILDNASLWKRLFGRDYRKAVRVYRRVAAKRKKAPRSQMTQALRTVAKHLERRAQFDSHATYRKTFGANFQGVDSPWEGFHQVLVWYEQIFVSLPDHQAQAEPFRQVVFTGRTERLRAIKATAASVHEHRAALGDVVRRVTEFTRAVPGQRGLVVSGSFGEILICLQKLVQDLRCVLQVTDSARIKDTVPMRDLPNILALAGQCRVAMTAVETDTELSGILGNVYRGVSSEIEPIEQTVHFAASVACGSLPQKCIEWLLCPDYGTRLPELRVWLKDAHGCAAKFRGILEALTETSGSEAWNGAIENSWGSLQARAEHALGYREDLPKWIHFLRLRIKSREQGLERLTGLTDAGTLQPEELGRAFRFTFHNTLARSVFSDQAELSHVTGVTQEQVREQFSAADKEAIRLYSERVAALIDQRLVPPGKQSGPVKEWSEMALINKELNKQKRHIPIRQLIQRAPGALQALKPCFMMGPLSVAQYLAPGQLKFDLVVMDEASQLKPEDAIGALARGGKVVIVGDPKQLPPTTFFQRVSLDAEEEVPEDTRAVVEEGESILDVASTLFQPVRRLRWHYRSQHHSLIAFSNKEFYQGDLIIFPSAYHKTEALGVKYHYIADGIYDNSRNPREAAVVVEAVLEHMRRHPSESLGVVTLNFEQRELIEELLDKKLREDPAAIAFQEKMKGGQETLFVKNLENVQGDERDVIFISTTYGPDAQGNQFNRFGPITHANGHRRLNVLFTRAKMRTEVFSCLDPDRIHTAANSPWGVRALKQYLIFAKTGILHQADEGLAQPTNDFERAVGAVLKEKGYEVAPQVGVAGFFIDLAVKHPAKAGAYLLGIECDGASYHSGRSARDRDRLRQEILEKLGWKIHRIWSTDWFKSRDNEIKRLTHRIDEILKSDPEYKRMQEKASRRETLRRRLIELRDEIGRAFPETSADKCLLRDSVLEEFMQKRPKTRDEWFRKVQEQVRSSIDSKQVGRYLDRVLALIVEYD